jgi:hypothetical protein
VAQVAIVPNSSNSGQRQERYTLMNPLLGGIGGPTIHPDASIRI